MKFSTPALRFAYLEDDAATKANQHDAAVMALNLANQDVDAAKTNAANLRESFRRAGVAPGAREEEEARALDAMVERKKMARQKSSDTLAAVTNRSAPARDRLLEARRAIGGRKIGDLETVPVEVDTPAGATVMDALATRIAELAKKERRHKAVKESRLPPEMVEKALIRDVDTLAARGGIQISGLYGEAKRARIAWPLRNLAAEPNRLGNGEQPRVIDMEALAARFWRKEIVAEIKAAVKEAYDGPAGDEVFAPDERQQALRALDAEIDTLQRRVAEMVWAAIENGHDDVDFPAGLPAKAILGIR